MTTVLLDADCVFVDFVGGVLKNVAITTGQQYSRDQITEFDIGKALGISFTDWTSGIIPGFCRALKPLPHAIDGIKRLMSIADVHIVTSPWEACPTWHSERTAWVAEHLGLKYDHVHHTHAKHMVQGDILVDDKLSTVVTWQQAHPHGIGVVWDCPWNASNEWHGLRTSNWDTVADIVENFRPTTRREQDIALIEGVLDVVLTAAGRSLDEFGGSAECATILLEAVEGRQ